jgi:uncharacterized membrane protein
MNWAHVHLVLNHIPVLGTVFGLTLLGYAVIRRDDTLKKAALGAFVAIALLALPVYFTGEPAEELVEGAAGISKTAIEAHEQSALISLVGVELLGIIALIGLVAARRRPVSATVGGVTLIVSLATAALMARTANLGGQVHHEEIRAGAPAPPPERDIGEAR